MQQQQKEQQQNTKTWYDRFHKKQYYVRCNKSFKLNHLKKGNLCVEPIHLS